MNQLALFAMIAIAFVAVVMLFVIIAKFSHFKVENDELKSNAGTPVPLTEICQIGGQLEIVNEVNAGLNGNYAFAFIGEDQRLRVVDLVGVTFLEVEGDNRFRSHTGNFRLIRTEVYGDNTVSPGYQLKEITVLSESISDRGVSNASELLELRKD